MDVFVSPCWLNDDWRWGFYYSQCDTMALRPIRIRLMIFERIFLLLFQLSSVRLPCTARKCALVSLSNHKQCRYIYGQPQWAGEHMCWLSTHSGKNEKPEKRPSLEMGQNSVVHFPFTKRANVFITKILRK